MTGKQFRTQNDLKIRTFSGHISRIKNIKFIQNEYKIPKQMLSKNYAIHILEKKARDFGYIDSIKSEYISFVSGPILLTAPHSCLLRKGTPKNQL